MYLFLLLGKDFIGDPEVGRRMHGYRMRIEVFLCRWGLSGVKRLAFRVIAALGLGRTAIIYCRKETNQ